jgi:hypothetical protein
MQKQEWAAKSKSLEKKFPEILKNQVKIKIIS